MEALTGSQASGDQDGDVARALPQMTYAESKAKIISGLGGILLLSLLRGVVFRWSHPDVFYEVIACAAAAFMSLLFWFPPRITLRAEGIKGVSFGYTWLDVPWNAVDSMEMFRTPIVQTVGAKPTGGERALGFRIKPDQRDAVTPKSGMYGYDAVITSMWDFSLDRIADQCARYWHAQGGSGELQNRLETYASRQLQLTS